MRFTYSIKSKNLNRIMTEDTSGDIESPSPGEVRSDHSRKWRVIGFGTLLFVVVGGLLIALGITIGTNAGDGIDSSANAIGSNPETVAPGDEGVTSPAEPTTDQMATPVDATTSQVYKTQYINADGPIESKVRIIDPSVADGYESCEGLRDDILNAVKYLASSIIAQESAYSEWYENCGPNPNATPSPSSGATPTVGTESDFSSESGTATSMATAKEDSFGTNNQVEGVDEADVVKSDGDFVFAAYGDLLYAWNATDGTKGISITAMPYEAINLTDCYSSNGMLDAMPLMTDMMIWNPCYQPKPRIDSLLLHGTRLTAIVSEDKLWYYGMKEESKPKIISDSTKITIRVYDISDVPTDGSPLTLLGEKVINGYYNTARSIGDTAVVIITAYVDTAQFSSDIYRWNPQYCGLNSTEYEELAVKTALNKTEPFVDQMMEELQLYNGGTCDNIFQVAAMQSGDAEVGASIDLLGNYVQLLSFNMSSDFSNDQTATTTDVAEIVANVGGAFSSGWISSVYASQDFAAILSVGGKWNNATGMWDQSTFILGFDINGTAPKPFSYAEIPGAPLNQYSADLYQGHLRVVTTEWFWNETTSSTTNKIFVLKVPNAEEGEGPEMLLTGETDHVGKPNESVMSVRFMETKAYIVTFLRTDPFYVIDLSDPSKPTLLGQLEIPGFSSYLHPIEIDGIPLMLGIGSNVNETTGWESGVKISLFNVSDPMKLKEIAVFVDEGAYSSGSWDFKSFRYLPLSEKLILPKTEWTSTEAGNFDGFVVYDITLNKIEASYSIQHASSYDMYSGCWYSAYMPARSLVFQSKLTTILSHSVISTDLETGDKLWNLTLEGLNNTVCSPYLYY
ncbi:hypothetical protein ACHAXA_002502 [Cyclostephanos tholiformis]|uniref:Beta propeller domain-containing protein n=1 Tax=Cyclostephanos tholiformis TaxID=382380 RepID=A0ABD3SD73_9STRA